MENGQRRSLAQALQTADVSPEAWAVINEGKPRPVAVENSKPRTLEREETQKDAASRTTAAGQVNLSVRIDQGLAERLLRVAFERKLQKREPFTQRDIVAEAVTQWLRKYSHSTG